MPLVVALVALLSMLLVATSARADALPSLGVNDVRSDGILVPNAAWQGADDLDLLAQSGVGLYRGRLRLDCVDPDGTGTYDFRGTRPGCGGLSYDALVEALARRGQTYLPVLITFGPSAVGPYAPLPPTADGAGPAPSYAQFAAFAAAAARRYGPQGTFWAQCDCPPHPIRAWEIWNEQNNGWWWNGRASSEEYAALFAHTREALRAVDPGARAVVGGFTWDPNGQPSFIAPEQMVAVLARSNANAFDAVAIHPYSDARGQTAEQIATSAMAYVDLMAAQLRASTGPGPGGAPRQQIWITEMGWSDTDASPGDIAGALGVFLGQLDGGRRAAANVGPVLWYMLRDNATKGVRDDQLGMRLTGPAGQDLGAKAVWPVFVDAARRAAPVGLPDPLPDTGAYVAPAPPPVTLRARPPAPRVVLTLAPRLRASRDAVRVTVSCPRSAGSTCRGSIRLRVVRRGRLVTSGTAALSLRAGRTVTRRVRLSAAGRTELRRKRRMGVRVTVRASSGGVTAQATRSVRLSLPRHAAHRRR